jgi:hypothetical protein
MADIETGVKLEDKWRRQTLGEDVDELSSRRDVHNANFPNGDHVTDEVESNLDMLHALMLNEVGRQVDDTEIVTIDKCDAG